MKIHRDKAQGSVDWLLLRSGKITASAADALVTPLGVVKKGAAVETLMFQVLAEQWQGGTLSSFQGTLEMDNGTIREEKAREMFTMETNLEAGEVSFIESDDGRIGCSPDAVIKGDLAGLEIKSPKIDNHLKYLHRAEVPPEYVLQVQFSLYVTKWPEWYFMSYRPSFPSLIIKVLPDPKIQESIEKSLNDFWPEFDSRMNNLVRLNGGPPSPKTRGVIPFPKRFISSNENDYLAGS